MFWLLFGMFIGGLVCLGVGWLLRRADVRRRDSGGLGYKACPRCALSVPNEAEVCRGCGFRFLPA